MAKHYNSIVKCKDFQVEDLVLRKVTGATKDATQGKLGLIGKDHTGSHRGIGREPITWRHLTGKSCITHGIQST